MTEMPKKRFSLGLGEEPSGNYGGGKHGRGTGGGRSSENYDMYREEAGREGRFDEYDSFGRGKPGTETNFLGGRSGSEDASAAYAAQFEDILRQLPQDPNEETMAYSPFTEGQWQEAINRARAYGRSLGLSDSEMEDIESSVGAYTD